MPSQSFQVSEPTRSSRLNNMENVDEFHIRPCLVDSASVIDFPAGLVMVTGLAPNPSHFAAPSAPQVSL